MSTVATSKIEHPFLETLRPEYREVLCKNARDLDFAKGDILFRQGEPANRFFLIESGEIAVERHSPDGHDIPVQMVRGGDVLGWSWLFPPYSWHFQARAVESGHAIVLDGAHLLITCEEHPRFGYCLMKRMAQLAIQRLEQEGKMLGQEIAAGGYNR